MMKRGDKLHNASSEDQQKLDSARQNNRINIAGNPWIGEVWASLLSSSRVAQPERERERLPLYLYFFGEEDPTIVYLLFPLS